MKVHLPIKILSMFLCCILSMSIFSAALPVTAKAAGDGIIRVRIATASDVSRVTVCSRGNFSISTEPPIPFTAGKQAEVFVEGGQLNIELDGAKYAMGSRFRLVRHLPDAITNAVYFKSPKLPNYFPGDIEFILRSGKIQTVNHVFIEDYLRGVLTAEWSQSHNFESQKSMAIMARTKARRCMASHASNYYDIKNTSADQNYRGVVPSHTTTARAVAETEGMVVRYRGSIIEGTYGASNGGQIEVSENWWGGSPRPYNTVKDDPYDYRNPKSPVRRLKVYADFSEHLSEKGMAGLDELLKAEIPAQLDGSVYSTAADDIEICAVKNIYPHAPKYPEPSRVYTKMRFELRVKARRLSDASMAELPDTIAVDIDIFPALDGSRFGLSLNSGANELFTVAQDGGNFVIESRRWGHGVGYSQYGAEQMAKEGHDWREILDFYNDGKVTYPTEKFSRPQLTSLESGPVATPTITPKPTALPECKLFDAPLKAMADVRSSLNMRVEPMNGANIVYTLARHEEVAAIGTIGEWTFIENKDGQVGYVMSKYLIMTDSPMPTSDPGVTYPPTPTPLPTPTPVIVPETGRYMQVVCNTYVNFREGPDMNYGVITRLHNGDIVKLLDVSGTWSHVTYNGREGYVSSGLLTAVNTATPTPSYAPTQTPAATPQNTEPAPRTARVKCNGMLNVRAQPDEHSRRIGMLRRDDIVSVLYERNGWARIEYEGREAYVSAKYLRYASEPTPPAPTAAVTSAPTALPTQTPTATPSAEGHATLRCKGAMNIRQLPTKESASLHVIHDGDRLIVSSTGNGVSGEWAAITYRGIRGYVKTKYLEFDGGLKPAPTATIAPTAAPTDKPEPTDEPAPTDAPKPSYKPHAATKGRVTASELNMRRTASTSSEVLYSLKRNTEVEILGATADGKWYYARYGEHEGYCSAEFIILTESADAMAAAGEGNYGSVLFAAPDENAEIVRTLKEGEVVAIFEENDGWLHVRSIDGQKGYMRCGEAA